MTDAIPLNSFSFENEPCIEIPLIKKGFYPRYKLFLLNLQVEDVSVCMKWGQNATTVIPTYVTDVTCEANQKVDGEKEGKRVTNAIAEAIDLIGRPLDKDLRLPTIMEIDIERSSKGEINMTWTTAFVNGEGAFYQTKGTSHSFYRHINHMRIFPSSPVMMTGEVQLIGYIK